MSYRNPTTTRFGKIIKNVAKTMALGVIPISILQPAVSISTPSLLFTFEKSPLDPLWDR